MLTRTILLAALLLASAGAGAVAQTAALPCDGETEDLNAKIACERLREQSRPDRCRAAGGAQLNPPSAGRAVTNFGDTMRHGTTSWGVDYETTGPMVTSPISGWVLFSGSWRFYRDVVIIDACTIDVIVLGMSTRSVRSQTAVSAGEPIGTVMQPGPDTIIHLQVRKRGTPINPFGPLVQE